MRRRQSHRFRVGPALCGLATCIGLLAAPGGAATFNVTNLNDSNTGSLRQAIEDANTAAGADTITFQAGLTGTITLSTGGLMISDGLTIIGPGINIITISGNNASLVFDVFAPGDTVAISDLTISDGLNSFGGGINNSSELMLDNCVVSNNSAPVVGGGILNAGTLTVNNCTISDNSVTPGTSRIGSNRQGGGIYSAGTLTVTNSTFSGNDATGVLAGDRGQGGAVFNELGATATLTNCTLSGNSATGADGSIGIRGIISTNGADGQGGGIFNAGTLTVTHNTITGNAATGGTGVPTNGTGTGGGIFNETGGSATVGSTIVAGNSASTSNPDGSGSFTTGGFNFIGDGTGATGFTNGVSQDQVGTGAVPKDPLLGPLQDNGGPTLTHALIFPSKAIGKANRLSFPATDQRGVARAQPTGRKPDIGAYELEILALNNITVNETPGGTLATYTVTLSVASNRTVTVDVATVASPGTATPNVDYTALSTTTLTFAPGDTTKTFSVPVLDDTLYEAPETFKAVMSNPVNAGLFADGGQTMIFDNDPVPVVTANEPVVTEGNSGTTPMAFTVSLDKVSGRPVTVSYSFPGGTAINGVDYTLGPLTPLVFTPGQMTKTITVTVNGDTLSEANEKVRLRIDDVVFGDVGKKISVGTIMDDDTLPTLSINDPVAVEEGDSETTTVTFTVTLSPASGQTVTVTYATGNGTALKPGDYIGTAGKLTFAAGDTTKTITVGVRGDTFVEPNETFVVNLSAPSAASIADTQGQATITNDDP